MANTAAEQAVADKAAEQAAADKAAAEQAAADKAAADKAAADKAAADKEAAEQAAADKAAADLKKKANEIKKIMENNDVKTLYENSKGEFFTSKSLAVLSESGKEKNIQTYNYE